MTTELTWDALLDALWTLQKWEWVLVSPEISSRLSTVKPERFVRPWIHQKWSLYSPNRSLGPSLNSGFPGKSIEFSRNKPNSSDANFEFLRNEQWILLKLALDSVENKFWILLKYTLDSNSSRSEFLRVQLWIRQKWAQAYLKISSRYSKNHLRILQKWALDSSEMLYGFSRNEPWILLKRALDSQEMGSKLSRHRLLTFQR